MLLAHTPLTLSLLDWPKLSPPPPPPPFPPELAKNSPPPPPFVILLCLMPETILLIKPLHGWERVNLNFLWNN